VKFGRVPIDETAGALLVHSVRGEGVSLKKGAKLGPDEIEKLRAAGIDAVTACRFEPGDVPEDEAAAELALPLVGPGIEAGQAFTGRVNLHARHAGVLRLDAATIDAVNHLDEALTVATLDDYAAVAPGQLVATIKIIPFAAPAAALADAVGRLQEAAPAMRVHAYRGISAFLIQTTLASVKSSVLDKTAAITRERIHEVGGRLLGERRCAHDARAVAAAVAEAPPVDLLLVAGASAITDRRDVLPAGIEAAGGRVDHFGMPVDPGNLLLLAHRDGAAVLGLPGCARSPKLNGFDWVLQRIGAGLGVDRDQIMAMGVGGLLAEIPTRPQPREVAPPPGTPRVAVVVLAAGQSRRMGRLNKLVETVGSKPMVAHPVDAALASRAVEVVVVTGNEPDRVRAALAGRAVRFVHNADFEAGLASSLKAGIRALGDDVDGAVIGLGDMPRITAQHLDRLIAAFEPAAQASVVVPTVDGKRGNPVLWGRRHFEAIRQLEGDAGARALIGANAGEVAEVAMEDDAALVDVDTAAALDAVRGEGR
jgi:molybdenum cofactor cytidylyltransferase